MGNASFNQDWYGMQAKVLAQSDDRVVVDYGCKGRGIVKNYKVLRMSKEELFTKITTLPRWQGKFEIDETDHTIKLKNYGQVENLIDLLDERYTRSDVTDEEYDTRAKKWVAAVV